VSTPLPNQEELARLLTIHCRPRGPIAVDGTALARVCRLAAQERPPFRLVVKPGQDAELSPHELRGAIRQLIEGGRIIRQRGRRCPQCRSTAIRIEQSPRHPGWKITCTNCGATIRRPKSVC
jgi:predicted RNA-binding Zn-ribbon protein involved in translation (DUF1610 family)